MPDPVITRFCADYGIDIRQYNRLKSLATKAHAAQVAWSSENQPGLEKKANDAVAKFEEMANSCGMTVQWPGPWPRVIKGDHNRDLPE